MIIKDYYQIMGVAVNATSEEIKQAYRRLAQKYHPDVNQAPDAEQQFKEICAAYDILKDSEKRALYNSKRNILLPAKASWLRTSLYNLRMQKNNFAQKAALFYAKKQAGTQASTFRTKSYQQEVSWWAQLIDLSVTHRLFFNFATMIIIGGIIVILLNLLINEFNLHAQQQQMTVAVLNHDTSIVTEWEQIEPTTQLALLNDKELKIALLQFYLHQLGEKTVEKLLTFNEKVQNAIFYDDTVRDLLINYYLSEVKTATNQHNFNHAEKLLKAVQKHYPNTQQLIVQQDAIQHQRAQQLVLLTKHYMRCLQPQTDYAANCMKDRQQSYFDLQLVALYDVDLANEIYGQYTEQTLEQNNYQKAEELVRDWEEILPNATKKRVELKSFLSDTPQNFMLKLKYPHLIPKKSGISTLAHAMAEVTKLLQHWQTALFGQIDTQKTVKTLVAHALSLQQTQGTVQQVQGMIVASDSESADVSDPVAPVAIENVVENPNIINTIAVTEAVTVEQTDDSEIAQLLNTCQTHLDANRLTTGRPGTALECYRTVLTKDADNAIAKGNLQKMEQTYRSWLETALMKKNVEDANIYLNRLRTVNMQAVDLDKLQQRVQQLNQEVVIVEKAPLVKSTEKIALAGTTSSAKLTEKTILANTSPSVELITTPSTGQQPGTLVQKETKEQGCQHCNCGDLYRRLSMGIKQNEEERAFLNDCDQLF